MQRTTSFRRRLVYAAAAACALAAGGTTTGALAAAWPEKPVVLVVPYSAGGHTDVVARLLAVPMGQVLGQSVLVENTVGAGGTIAPNRVAKAKADGYTILIHHMGMATAPALYKKLPYDPLKDFVGVSFLGRTGYVVGVPAASGVQTLGELLQRARAQPGQLNYASAGNGSASHLASASLAAQAGIKLQHIPMKSTGDATTELLAGRVQLVTGATIGMLAFQKDPRVKLLAYSGQQRSRFLPDLPTVAESGVPGYAFDSWLGLLAPAGTPPAEVERINTAVRKVLAEPVVQERLARVGVEAATLPAAEFQRLLKDDWEASGRIVKAADVRIE